MRKRRWLATVAGLPLLLCGLVPPPAVSAAAPVQVILDGRTLALNPPATIVNDRTLVPVRGLFEAMGADLTWDEVKREVTVNRLNRYVRLKIDRHLACLNQTCTQAATLDVPAAISQDRTFVPVRFVSQAMGARVTWDEARRAVVIETDKAPDYNIANVTIPTLTPGQSVSGPISLRSQGVQGNRVQYLMIDPATGAGPMIAAGVDPSASYTFTPDPTVTGTRLIVASVRDQSGRVHYSDPVPVQIAVQPRVEVTGIASGATVTEPITIASSVNFVATHVSFQLVNSMGHTEDLGTVGPGDSITWYPQVPGQNGDRWLRATAYDVNGKAYPSVHVPIRVQSGHRNFLSGVQEGSTLTRPLSLRVSTNYPVEYVQYFLDDEHLAWGFSPWWAFGPELNGKHKLHVHIMDKQGVLRVLGPYNFTINATPSVWLSGIGPKQVVTGAVTLKSSTNVEISTLEYILTNPANGQTRSLGSTGRWGSLSWTPAGADAGDRVIQAVGRNAAGQAIWSEKVSFRVFLGTVYGPKAVVQQNQFKELASRLSVPAYRDTGMSASLQVAQAILETGWGQSVPVDKYTGQFSNNLFGIKGKGTAGSIISNTWEEYNGVAFRVDDYFRAYNSIEESWADHKDLLLTRSWYAPFRAVMAEPIQGAWALRRSGYATDSQYPVKLINIMKQNDLFKLDLIEL